MKWVIHHIGRTFQLAALLALPSAIWVAEISHSESGAIGIFVGCVLIFSLGWLLNRLASRA